MAVQTTTLEVPTAIALQRNTNGKTVISQIASALGYAEESVRSTLRKERRNESISLLAWLVQNHPAQYHKAIAALIDARRDEHEGRNDDALRIIKRFVPKATTN